MRSYFYGGLGAGADYMAFTSHDKRRFFFSNSKYYDQVIVTPYFRAQKIRNLWIMHFPSPIHVHYSLSTCLACTLGHIYWQADGVYHHIDVKNGVLSYYRASNHTGVFFVHIDMILDKTHNGVRYSDLGYMDCVYEETTIQVYVPSPYKDLHLPLWAWTWIGHNYDLYLELCQYAHDYFMLDESSGVSVPFSSMFSSFVGKKLNTYRKFNGPRTMYFESPSSFINKFFQGDYITHPLLAGEVSAPDLFKNLAEVLELEDYPTEDRLWQYTVIYHRIYIGDYLVTIAEAESTTKTQLILDLLTDHFKFSTENTQAAMNILPPSTFIAPVYKTVEKWGIEIANPCARWLDYEYYYDVELDDAFPHHPIKYRFTESYPIFMGYSGLL